jgi:hypothetical protein
VLAADISNSMDADEQQASGTAISLRSVIRRLLRPSPEEHADASP